MHYQRAPETVLQQALSRPTLSGALQWLARLGPDELDGALAHTGAFTAATQRHPREAFEMLETLALTILKRLKRLTWHS
jgi:hypothetical protein